MPYRFVVLGAGRPHEGEQHSALRSTHGAAGVMDWTLQAMSFIEPDLHFACGYDSASIMQRYPQFRFWPNEDWAQTRAAWSLLQVPVDQDAPTSWIVAYSDIIFRTAAVKRLLECEADVVVGVDSLWQHRFAGRSMADLQRCEKICLAGRAVTRLGADISVEHASGEFIGLVHFGAAAIERLRELQLDPPQSLRRASLSDLVERFRIGGARVLAVDLRGDWAELNHPHDLARFVLGTKAQTLFRLRDMLRHARIEDLEAFTVREWRRDPSEISKVIQSRFEGRNVIVRSSAASEDTFSSSAAGAHDSILDVNATDPSEFQRAVEMVIASYSSADDGNEVLVQPMLSGVQLSGVALTRVLTSGAPYYVVNYDDRSGSTLSVTSGTSDDHRTIIVRRDVLPDSPAIPDSIRSLMRALHEIEELLNYDALDVEFAVTAEHGLHIFQVRPLAVAPTTFLDDESIFGEIDSGKRFFVQMQSGAPWIVGRRAIFGIMPDWNPAEIIGVRPSPLALSLYRDLVGNEVWAKQRAEYGYRDVRPSPLFFSFSGQPYVDVRASINSFVPNDLNDAAAERLVNFCIDWLVRHPASHDKIEFDVIPTCLDLDFTRWVDRLGRDARMAERDLEELREALCRLTNRGMSRVSDDLQAIRALERRSASLQMSTMPTLQKAFAFLDDAKRLGTLPFAHLARNAFVAVALLRSSISAGVLSEEDVDGFLGSLKTVSGALTEDAQSCASGSLPWEAFVDKYGHLRPGTYDIGSPCYAEDPERFLRPIVDRARAAAQPVSPIPPRWLDACERLAKATGDIGLTADSLALDAFLRRSIEGREYSKFAFTRNLSAALNLFVAWGESHGLGRDDLSLLNIEDFRIAGAGSMFMWRPLDDGALAGLQARIDEARKQRLMTELIELPPLLCSVNDFQAFSYPASLPNFVGNVSVSAQVVALELKGDVSIDGCIVLIPQADPGYDWLFGRGISGLVTKYGGANSHMAIRAAEFGLSAAIGVGEVQYKLLASAEEISLDPRGRMVRILR